MRKQALLISLLIYLISCTSNDNGVIHSGKIAVPKPVRTSLGISQIESEKIKEFDHFLSELSSHQMIHASETDLHEMVKKYLYESTISEGFDLHIQEIGRLDTFRLVFHEYFDLYDDWSKTYLNIFSPSGKLLQYLKLWELSFEGNTSINFINNEIVEITYHDFFKEEDIQTHALITDQNFYLSHSSKVNDQVEGTIYQYYEIVEGGVLKNLSQNTQISKGRYFPQSSAKLLSLSELQQYNLEEIRLMKDEILAEYGYSFSDISTRNYFEMQDWYTPISENVDSLLTDIEQRNFDSLSKVEKEY